VLGVVLEMVELLSLERDVSLELELGLLAFVESARPPGELDVAELVVVEDCAVSVELLELGLVLDELGVDDVLLLRLGLELLGLVLELLLPYVEPVWPEVELWPVEAVLP